MPHKDIRITVSIFDTSVYRLDYWCKMFSRNRGRLLDEMILIMSTKYGEWHPNLAKGELEYINAVRWDNTKKRGYIIEK